MLSFITDLQQKIKFRSYDMHRFIPKVSLELEFGNYQLKTATTPTELKSAFSLRHQIFFDSAGKENGILYDIDQFDNLCDHLIIKDKKTGDVVGTYRMNNSSLAKDFYSSTEFSLQKIVYSGKNCVELGRACIHQDHRNGIVISLLWRGIYSYMKNCRADILFGCSSIKNVNARQTALVLRYFESVDLIDAVFKTYPQYVFKVPLLEEYQSEYARELTSDEVNEAKNLIPPLLKSYLKFGAKVTGEPAWDSEMGCVDFLTVMRVENLSTQIERKFKNI